MPMPSDTKQPTATEARDRKVSGLRRHSRQQNEQSLERIRTAAKTIFTDKGYIGVTLDEIARGAGVSRQTLYRHFPTKYELALDYLTGTRSKSLAIWKSLSANDLNDRQSALAWIRSIMSHYVNRYDSQTYFEVAATEPAYRAVLAEEIAAIIEALGWMHSAFAKAARNPDGLSWAKAHLFIATVMERSDFIAMKEEWIKADHLEQILADWLIALADQAE